MSDPKIWNGTAWVRPRFFDGTSWLEYTPPVYDVPMSWDFPTADSLPKGTYGQWAAPGYIWRDNGSGGLLSGASVGVNGSDTFNVEGALGHQIRGEASISWVRTGGSSEGYPNEFTFTCGLSGAGSSAKYQTTHNLEVNYTKTVYTPPMTIGAAPWGNPNRQFTFDINQNTADYSTPYIQGQLRCDWFRIFDMTAGTVLMALGDPGWEPKVWTGSQWR